MKSYPIYPSILAFDLLRLREQVELLDAAGAAGLHFDVMDGHFVPNLTFGAMVPAALRAVTNRCFTAHLMTYQPETLIDAMALAGVSRLYLHPEATPHIHRALCQVREAGMEPAVAINPGTPIITLEPLLELVTSVLVMSVDPGFGGQVFQPAAIGRVAQVCALQERLGLSVQIECDGGVDAHTIRPLVEAGMTGAIVGTALFRDGDPVQTLREIMEAAAR